MIGWTYHPLIRFVKRKEGEPHFHLVVRNWHLFLFAVPTVSQRALSFPIRKLALGLYEQNFPFLFCIFFLFWVDGTADVTFHPFLFAGNRSVRTDLFLFSGGQRN
jgi:hypothetical protein